MHSIPSTRSALRAFARLPALPTLALLACAPVSLAQERVPLTLQDTLGVRYSPRVVSASYLGDLVRLRFPDGVRWFDPAKKDFVEAPEEAVVEEAPGRSVRPTRRVSVQPIPGVVQPAGYRVGNIVLGRGDDAQSVTLGGGCREPHMAPDGAQISFVRDGDLYVTPKLGEPAWRVTGDGGPQVLNGALDWVYQEEVYGRGNFQAHWWSPDSAHVAFLTIDSRAVKPFTVIDHAPTRVLGDERSVRTEVTLYPKAGDPNPTARLSIATPASQSVVSVDLASRYEPGFLVVRVGWRPDASEAFVQVTNRVQNWLELLAVDPATGAVRRVLREESDTWVEILGQPRWLEDGSFLWQTERRGTKDYDRYTAAGKRIAETVKTDFDALSIQRIDEEKGVLWFVGRGESPIDRHLFRVGLDGRGLKQLTSGPGSHSTRLAADGSSFLDTVSSSTERPETRVCDADGKVLLRVASSPSAASQRHGLVRKQAFVIEARDGYPLDVTAIVPEGEGPFPIFLDTYSGPDAPTVRNRWSHSAWHQFLVQEGMLVLQCNVRTASGRGHQATSLCYQQLGVQELKDLEDAIAFACENLGGDAEHVGIRGWSYGGFMSAYALTHSDKFALGLAGAGVHDWQLYDTIYTERYMNTPQANPDGYAKTSVVDAAKNLRGHLVILHGTKDDNVHLQNSIRLVDELQRAGKDSFEFMVYPGSRHGVRSRAQRTHMRRLEWRAIQTHLLGR